MICAQAALWIVNKFFLFLPSILYHVHHFVTHRRTQVLENHPGQDRAWTSSVVRFPKPKTFNKLNHKFMFPSHPFYVISSASPLPWHLTGDVDGVDEVLWNSVPNVHQTGRVDDDIGPKGGLQHTAVVCDVPLNDHHLCPLWGRSRKTVKTMLYVCNLEWGLFQVPQNTSMACMYAMEKGGEGRLSLFTKHCKTSFWIDLMEDNTVLLQREHVLHICWKFNWETTMDKW